MPTQFSKQEGNDRGGDLYNIDLCGWGRRGKIESHAFQNIIEPEYVGKPALCRSKADALLCERKANISVDIISNRIIGKLENSKQSEEEKSEQSPSRKLHS